MYKLFKASRNCRFLKENRLLLHILARPDLAPYHLLKATAARLHNQTTSLGHRVIDYMKISWRKRIANVGNCFGCKSWVFLINSWRNLQTHLGLWIPPHFCLHFGTYLASKACHNYYFWEIARPSYARQYLNLSFRSSDRFFVHSYYYCQVILCYNLCRFWRHCSSCFLLGLSMQKRSQVLARSLFGLCGWWERNHTRLH